jgi:hypothetical protein
MGGWRSNEIQVVNGMHQGVKNEDEEKEEDYEVEVKVVEGEMIVNSDGAHVKVCHLTS